MEFSRQEYWSGLPFPSPGDLPNPGMEPLSPALAGGFFTAEPSGKPWSTFLLMKRLGKAINIAQHRYLITTACFPWEKQLAAQSS